MNHLTLCAKVLEREMRYIDRNDPLCLLKLKYKWSESKQHNAGIATIDVQVYGERAIDIYNETDDGSFVIVQGRFENYQEGERYIAVVIGSKVEPIESFVPINKCCIVGRTGKAPQASNFKSGANKAIVNIAVNRYNDQAPNWYRAEAWGSKADLLTQHVPKGSLVGIQGQLLWMPMRDRETGAYLNGQQGVPYINTEQITLLSNKKQQEEDF